MKIIIRNANCFSYRGQNVGDLPILGKTIIERMRGELGEEAGEERGEFVVDGIFPFLKKEEVLRLIAYGKNLVFSGGYLWRGEGEWVKVKANFGLKVENLSAYEGAIRFAAEEMRKKWLKRGALVERGAVVEEGVFLGEGCMVDGRSRLCGNCSVEKNATICDSVLIDCKIGEGVTVTASYLKGAVVEAGATIGPFARLREGAKIGEKVKIGNFVEVKNSTIGKGSKAAHHSYIGDGEVGERCNVGCGVIFANYNGREKRRITVGDGAFLGSNVNLIAPLKVGKGAYIAAGTTVTEDLEEDAFCIGRSRQTVKDKKN